MQEVPCLREKLLASKEGLVSIHSCHTERCTVHEPRTINIFIININTTMNTTDIFMEKFVSLSHFKLRIHLLNILETGLRYIKQLLNSSSSSSRHFYPSFYLPSNAVF